MSVYFRLIISVTATTHIIADQKLLHRKMTGFCRPSLNCYGSI